MMVVKGVRMNPWLSSLLWFSLLYMYNPGASYFLPHFSNFAVSSSPRKAVIKHNLLDSTLDISPAQNGTIFKTLIRKGDARKGYPQREDSVKITW